MITARMLWIAVAMLLAPAAFGLAQGVWDEPEDAVEYSGRVAAWVENVTFADPEPRPIYGEWNLTGEQLVEGHTTFVTIERSPIAVEVPGHLNITGFVNCEYGADADYAFLLGTVPVPTRVNKAWVDCGHGARVVITPGSSLTPMSASPMVPTGELIPVETPHGMSSYAEEFVFTVNEPQGDGTVVAREMYAWATPIFPPWVHHDGTQKNFWMPLPRDRLAEMGESDFQVILESDDRLPR